MIVKENEIYFSKIKEGSIIPNKKDEDAGYDMYSCFDEDFFVIEPGQSLAVPTGIAIAFSNAYYAQVEERSSLAKIGIKKSGGVFDSGYRGEYLIVLYNTRKIPFIISKIDENLLDKTFIINGKKYHKNKSIIYPYKKAICQIVIQPIPKLVSKEISYKDLCDIESLRGKGGFGSSGK